MAVDKEYVEKQLAKLNAKKRLGVGKELRVKSTNCAPAIEPKKQEMVNINSFLFIAIEFK